METRTLLYIVHFSTNPGHLPSYYEANKVLIVRRNYAGLNSFLGHSTSAKLRQTSRQYNVQQNHYKNDALQKCTKVDKPLKAVKFFLVLSVTPAQQPD